MTPPLSKSYVGRGFSLAARQIAVFAALIGVVLVGCAGGAGKAAERERLRLRIAGTSTAEFADVPSLLAERKLGRDKYIVEPTFYAKPELAVAALASGEADFALGSLPAFWVAAARGAPITTVMEQARNGHVLIATKAVRTCADLDRRTVALNTPGATGGAMLRAYIEEACPGAKPEIVIVPGSPNRAAAYLAGTVDAAMLLRADAVRIERRAPGRIGFMEDFAVRWPTVATVGVFVNTGFAGRHPEAVEDYIRECLLAYRGIGMDAKRFAGEAAAVLGSDEDLLPLAEAYLHVNSWDVDGGLTPRGVQATIDFLTRTGTLIGPVAPASLVDRSFLDRVRADLAGPASQKITLNAEPAWTGRPVRSARGCQP